MKSFFKTVFIVGLCGVGALAVATVVLGKHRTHSAAEAIRDMARGEVDELLAKQQDLKKELTELRNEYPHQVALVRSQISEIDRDLEKLETEQTRAADIVKLCEQDLAYLEVQLGDAAREVVHRGSRYGIAEAERLVGRIAETRSMYLTRLDEISTQRHILQGERDQLEVELEAIRAEQAEFEAEYRTLVREIERLKRNEKSIELAEKRRGIGSAGHGENMDTLESIKSAVERARIEQEERLKAARVAPRSLDYETRARLLEIRRKREARQKIDATPENTGDVTEVADEGEDTELELTYEFANE